ncbi:methyltransferase domain-containing protein [Cubamyces menziesii]|nr:methyltransferase domain-containing protein [Cubamyces menziesii]
MLDGAPVDQLLEYARFLSEPLVSSLLALHPNDLGSASFEPPGEWNDWWDWAGGEVHHTSEDSTSVSEDPWLLLLKYYDLCRLSNSCSNGAAELSPDYDAIPGSLRTVVRKASLLAATREPGSTIFSSARSSLLVGTLHQQRASTEYMLPGMSPKKAHEVIMMSSFIGELLQSSTSLSSINHIVDVGAGQAYLSRTLRDRLGSHVLALDFSEVQTQGAAKRDDAVKKTKKKAGPSGPGGSSNGPPAGVHHAQTGQTRDRGEVDEPRHGSLTYVTAKIDARTLCEATDDWIRRRDDGTEAVVDNRARAGSGVLDPTPVLFVALHACGSLTPDIFRAFTASLKTEGSAASWTSRAAVVVGCCYNMMRSEDFPLSRALRSNSGRTTSLNANHFQLAAQVPAQWTRTTETLRDARLALRKIVWRALINDLFITAEPEAASEGTKPGSDDRRSRRLGRLNDAAYADWETFAHRVRTKLGLREDSLMRADRKRERRIEVFHVLRCIIGPVIESLIMLDRAVWVHEELEGTDLDVDLVNLFDQASGSGRNVAIVVRPHDSQP